MNKKTALITGVTGQDGAYLSKLLIENGYEVHGLLRRSASSDVVDARLKWLGIARKIKLHEGNITDLFSLIGAPKEVKPAEDQRFFPALCKRLCTLDTSDSTCMTMLSCAALAFGCGGF